MKYLPFAVVIIVLALGTLIEGKLSDRWGTAQSAKLDTFADNLDRVPINFGNWQGTDEEIDEEDFKASNCAKCVSRTYRNRDGQRVNVYLVAGSARHVTIHTPDWCYVGAGYEIIGGDVQQYTDAEATTVSPPPEYLTALFQKENVMETHRIRIFWSFSDDGTWRGPRMPKPTYAGRPALYKIYMITELDESGGDIASNPTLDFAREFLPILNDVLFEEPSTETGTNS